MRVRPAVLVSIAAVTAALLADLPARAEPRTTRMLSSPRTRPLSRGLKGVRQRIFGARLKQRGLIDGNQATQTDHYRYVGNGTLERTRSTMKRRVYRQGWGGGAEPWNLKVSRRDVAPDERSTTADFDRARRSGDLRGVRATVIRTRLRNDRTVETDTTYRLKDGVRRGPGRKKERRLRSYWPTSADWRSLF
jgi:hypothetical protein